MNSQLVWGIDIGGTKCAFVTGTPDGQVLSRKEVATTEFETWELLLEILLPEPGSVKGSGGDRSAGTQAESISLHSIRPLAIGVSCGGPLDEERGLILSPPNLPGWDEVPIVEWLQKRYGVPAFLQNDANACAVAEWLFGAGKGTRNMVFLTFGTGLGAGLILDGRLYRGTNGMAGEIGHVRAKADGPAGYGKAGSYEGFCSGGGIRQLSGGRSAKEVTELAASGDEAMQEVLRESGEMLGHCVSILIDLFNPQRVVIGSVFARAEAWFRGPMEQVIAREALPLSARVCKVVPAVLGDQIGDVAALSVAILEMKRENHLQRKAANQYEQE